jgi:hypothetical protein
MPALRRCLPILLLLGMAACTAAGPTPGTPEFAAGRVSRAYDCGLRIDRARVTAGLGREERRRFMAANAAFAVKSYNAPRPCSAEERWSVQREVGALGRR